MDYCFYVEVKNEAGNSHKYYFEVRKFPGLTDKQLAEYGFTVDSITEAIFSGDIREIGDRAFKDYGNLTTVNLPSCLDWRIGSGAFSGCINLTRINLSPRLESIGIGAFDGCVNLTDINLMDDSTFGKMEFEFGCYYISHKKIFFGGVEQDVEVMLSAEVGEQISQSQRDLFEDLMKNWNEVQHKILVAILNYYNNGEKYGYGPDEEDEFKLWWPDIDTEEQMISKLHLESIVINNFNEDGLYILFSRDWGGDDPDDNGVAVFIEDGEVTEVGYKDIAGYI